MFVIAHTQFDAAKQSALWVCVASFARVESPSGIESKNCEQKMNDYLLHEWESTWQLLA